MMVLLENECSFSGEDIQPLLFKKFSILLHSQVARMQKLWVQGLAPCTEPPGETFTTLYLFVSYASGSLCDC